LRACARVAEPIFGDLTRLWVDLSKIRLFRLLLFGFWVVSQFAHQHALLPLTRKTTGLKSAALYTTGPCLFGAKMGVRPEIAYLSIFDQSTEWVYSNVLVYRPRRPVCP